MITPIALSPAPRPIPVIASVSVVPYEPPLRRKGDTRAWFKATVTLTSGESSYSIGHTPKKTFDKAYCNVRQPGSAYKSQIGHYNQKFGTVRVG